MAYAVNVCFAPDATCSRISLAQSTMASPKSLASSARAATRPTTEKRISGLPLAPSVPSAPSTRRRTFSRPLRIGDEHPGQGARFHGHLGETWSFRPRVFLVHIPLGEFRFGDTDAGVLRLVIFVPAAGHVFGDRMLIHLLRFELAAREH